MNISSLFDGSRWFGEGEFDAEQVAHLAVEVGETGLGAAEHADLDVALRREALGAE